MKRSSDASASSPRRRGSSVVITVALCATLLGGCAAFSTPQPSGNGTSPAAGSTQPAKPAPKPIDRGDPDARFKAALELMKQNQPQDAEAALTALVKDFPQYSGPLTDLGILYAKSKRFDLAASAFAKAIADNPQNAVAYNWQGRLYREARDYNRAEQSYLKALSLNDNDGTAHLNLGILYDAYLNRPVDALPHYRAYQRLGSADDLRVLVWIAQIEKNQAGIAAKAAVAAPAPANAKPVTQPTKPSKAKEKKKS